MNNTKPKSVLLPRTDFVLSIVGKNTSPTREKKVLLQKLGSHLAPSDEVAGERSETEGEKKLRFCSFTPSLPSSRQSRATSLVRGRRELLKPQHLD